MLQFLKSIKSETFVGLLLLTGAGLLVYSSIRVTGWKVDEAEVYNVSVILDNVTGLGENTAVRMAGIKIGEIEGIFLENGKAKVVMKIFKKYPIRRNSEVSVKSLGILGDKYIEVTPGSEGLANLQDGESIFLVRKGADLDSLVGNLSIILDDLQAVTGSIRSNLGDKTGEERIDRILVNIETLTSEFGETAQKTNARIDSIMESLANFTGDLSKISDENRSEINNLIDRKSVV